MGLGRYSMRSLSSTPLCCAAGINLGGILAWEFLRECPVHLYLTRWLQSCKALLRSAQGCCLCACSARRLAPDISPSICGHTDSADADG